MKRWRVHQCTGEANSCWHFNVSRWNFNVSRWTNLWQALVSLKQALLHSVEGFYENLLLMAFIWSTWLKQSIPFRRRRNLYSFNEEVVLFKSVVIFNFAWSAFTLLASKVTNSLREFKLPRQEAQRTDDETKISVSRVLFVFCHLLLHQPDILRLPGFSS